MTLYLNNTLFQVKNFFLKPASASPLAALRIALGLTLLFQAYSMRSVIFDLFSSTGFIQGDLAKIINNPNLPQISSLHHLLDPLGVDEFACVLLVCFAYVTSLSLLTLGWHTRWAAIASWFLHWTLMNSADSTTYGIDLFAHVFLFYFIWVPVGAAWSVDAWKKGDLNPTSAAARLGLRLLQIHLCIAYLMSGIEKAQGIQWWNGEVLWRALSLPIYRQFDMSWLANWPHLAMLAGWASLVLELGYFIFIWPKATRKFWIAGIIGLHLGIMIFLGLHLFGLIMIVLTGCLFAFSAEPFPEMETV